MAEAARRVGQDGASVAEIARTYRVSADAVRRQLAARGVRAPRGAPRLRRVSAAEVAALYERGGLSMAQIAVRYGVSRWLVGARLDEAGVARRPRGKPIPLGEASARYQDGASLAVLTARYSVSTAAVSRLLAWLIFANVLRT